MLPLQIHPYHQRESQQRLVTPLKVQVISLRNVLKLNHLSLNQVPYSLPLHAPGALLLPCGGKRGQQLSNFITLPLSPSLLIPTTSHNIGKTWPYFNE